MIRNILAWTVVASGGFVTLVAQRPAEPAGFKYERPAIVREGAHRLAIDVPLLSGGAPFRVERRGGRFIAAAGLADLRLFDAQGKPVPYLIVAPPPAEPVWGVANVLPVAPAEKTSGFEADLGEPLQVDAIRVEGLPAPFLKRLTLEGSGDRVRWTMLVSEGTLFDLPDERLRATELTFTPGAFRYLRVTWDDTNSGRVPLPRSVRARLTPRYPRAPETTIPVGVERRPAEPGTSRYRVRLPGTHLPAVALVLDVGGGHVFRPASVFESRIVGSEAAPAELGRGTLVRVQRDGVTAAVLRVPIAPPAEAELDLLIEDGANPPLDLKGAALALAELPWIYVEAPAGGLLARYGNTGLQAPSYDLEAARDSIDLISIPEGVWGEAHALVESPPAGSAAPAPAPGAPLDPSTFEYLRPLPESRAGLTAVPLDAAVLAHSAGPSRRFSDLRVLDTAGRQIAYLLERRAEPLPLELRLAPAAEIKAKELRPTHAGALSVYALTLPYSSLPDATLLVETPARVFRRTVRVGVERAPDRRHREPWFDVLGSATWQHADAETPAPPFSLRIKPPDDVDALRLVVVEGDNAPLQIASARLLLPSYRVRFFRDDAAGLRLAYGRRDLQAPQYDLALLAPRVMGAAAEEVEPGAESRTAPELGKELISPRVFWVLVVGAVIVLLGLIARLLKAG